MKWKLNAALLGYQMEKLWNPRPETDNSQCDSKVPKAQDSPEDELLENSEKSIGALVHSTSSIPVKFVFAQISESSMNDKTKRKSIKL